MKKSTRVKGIICVVLLAVICVVFLTVILVEGYRYRDTTESQYMYMEKWTYIDAYGNEIAERSGLYEIENDEITIYSLAKSMYPHADIPSEINSIKVTSIGRTDYIEHYHYYGYDHDEHSLVSVNIPDSVVTVGNHFFARCVELKSVTGGEGITIIGAHAFRGCLELEEIALGSSLTSIGEWAFGGCFKLEELTIPDSMTSIGEKAFYGCRITVTAPHEPSYYGYTPDSGVTWIIE